MTFQNLIYQLACAKQHAEFVFERWPDEADGRGDLEHAIGLIGRCEGELDRVAEESS
jgi:hypothetical protein